MKDWQVVLSPDREVTHAVAWSENETLCGIEVQEITLDLMPLDAFPVRIGHSRNCPTCNAMAVFLAEP